MGILSVLTYRVLIWSLTKVQMFKLRICQRSMDRNIVYVDQIVGRGPVWRLLSKGEGKVTTEGKPQLSDWKHGGSGFISALRDWPNAA